jgi:hypothetical protein
MQEFIDINIFIAFPNATAYTQNTYWPKSELHRKWRFNVNFEGVEITMLIKEKNYLPLSLKNFLSKITLYVRYYITQIDFFNLFRIGQIPHTT